MILILLLHVLTAIKEPTERITTTEATTTQAATTKVTTTEARTTHTQAAAVRVTTTEARTDASPRRGKRFADAITTEPITSGLFRITRCRDFVGIRATNGNNERTQSGMAINQNSIPYNIA